MDLEGVKKREWFQELFSTSGRRSRQEFICAAIFIAIMSTAIRTTPLLRNLIFPEILLMYIGFTNVVKRLHDLDYSGYWAGAVYACFLALAGIGLMMEMDNPPNIYVPGFVGLIMFGVVALGFTIGLLFLFFKRGTIGNNRYGYDPVR